MIKKFIIFSLKFDGSFNVYSLTTDTYSEADKIDMMPVQNKTYDTEALAEAAIKDLPSSRYYIIQPVWVKEEPFSIEMP